jgi:hypothetical protein
MPILQARIGAAGGGGGDATAANQVLQLAQDATAAIQTNQVLQLEVNSAIPSVFKDAGDKSVFNENAFNNSVFKDPSSGDSNFYLNGSVAYWGQTNNGELQGIASVETDIKTFLQNSFTNNGSLFSPNTNNNVQTFTDTTLAGVGTQLETFLQAAGTRIAIKTISFSSGGAAQHDIILVYQNI